MITKRTWFKRSRGGLVITWYKGYFLFGFIPLYIKSVELDVR
jgi:hypothetical protein